MDLWKCGAEIWDEGKCHVKAKRDSLIDGMQISHSLQPEQSSDSPHQGMCSYRHFFCQVALSSSS